MELYRLAETCKYENFIEEMIRDRLVVGIADNALSGRLQLDPNLTLEKAKKTVRQSEAVRLCSRCGNDQHPIERYPCKGCSLPQMKPQRPLHQ